MYMIYDETGVILQFCNTEPTWTSLFKVIDDYFDNGLYYYDVVNDLILKKQDYTLDNLPLPCTITIEGISYEVTEQPTFEFDVAGEYTIEVDAGVEYLKKEFKYVVEA